MQPKKILEALTGDDADAQDSGAQSAGREDATNDAKAIDEGDPTRTVVTENGTTTSE